MFKQLSRSKRIRLCKAQHVHVIITKQTLWNDLTNALRVALNSLGRDWLHFVLKIESRMYCDMSQY